MADPFEAVLKKISSMSRRERLAVSFSALALAGIVLIALVVVQVWLPNRFLPYTHSVWQFSVKYPASWKKDENKFGAAAAFISPKEGALDVFQENVTVVVQDLSARPMSLKAYSDAAVGQIQKVFKENIKVIETAPAYFAGQTAHKFIYEGTDTKNPTLNLKAMHFWFIKDNRAYQFNYTALANKFDKYLATVEKMMSTFEVK